LFKPRNDDLMTAWGDVGQQPQAQNGKVQRLLLSELQFAPTEATLITDMTLLSV
jgi:hypothetical protein